MAGTYRYQHGDKPVEGYTILRGIGRGGFGEVYYAMSDGGREVALKVIQQNHDIELRGVRHCINLKSPHLVSIFDVKKNSDGLPFVIMEYVAGPSLRDLLPRDGRGLGTDKAAYLLREIAKGLSYLHERGIVHRDLKPENIFYEDGYAKIGDYGLSKYISVSRQSGQTISVGTVHYMAPEIGSGNYHQGIDIYALGIIFYELLTGTVPFNGDSMGEILMKHLTMEPDVSVLEEPFRPIVKKALAKNPIERYQSAREVVDAVFAIPEVAPRVARVEPQSLVSRTTAAAVNESDPLRGAETTPVPAPKTPAIPPPPPPLAPTPAPALTGAGGRSNWSERVVPGLATTGAMALALGLFTKNSGPMAISGFLVLLAAVTAAILGVEYWLAPRFRIATGTVRRLVTFGLVGLVLSSALAALAEAFGISGSFFHALPGLLAGLLFVDWHARARQDRQEQVSIGMAFSAGLFGLVAGAITARQSGLIPSAGLLASLSLIVNAASPFIPLSERRRPRPAAGDRTGEVITTGQHSESNDARIAFARAAPDAPTAVLPGPGGIPRPSPPSSSHRTRLIRPRDGTVIGGVCAGFAQRYGWDVVLVRAAFALIAIATIGLGFLAYLVLWMAMPRESAPPKPAKSPRVKAMRSCRGPGARPVWYGLSALCFASGVAVASMAPGNVENVIAWIFLNAIGALFLLRGKSRTREQSASPRTIAARSGWASMGSILVTLAVVAVALGVTATTKLDQYILHSVRLDRNSVPGERILHFVRSDALPTFALANFSLGVLCLLIARNWGGAAHVFRGLLGWTGLGTVGGILLLSAHRMIRVSYFNEVDFDIPFTWIALFALALLTAVSFTLLAWQGTAIVRDVSGVVPAASEQAA